jgi:hypothetical protein
MNVSPQRSPTLSRKWLKLRARGAKPNLNPWEEHTVRLRTQAIALAMITALAAAATPAAAGMCDQPPFGIKPAGMYDKLAALTGPETVHDLLHNICRAKYMHDTKMRVTLHQIGFSDEFIDGNDVGYVAIKVILAFKECIDAHHGAASGC